MCVNQKDPMLNRMKELIEQIKQADIAYYKNDKRYCSAAKHNNNVYALYDNGADNGYRRNCACTSQKRFNVMDDSAWRYYNTRHGFSAVFAYNAAL